MKLRNPYYQDPIEAQAIAVEAAVRAYLESKPAKQWIGLAKLRAEVPAVAAAPREVINAVLSRLGAEIDEAGSDNA